MKTPGPNATVRGFAHHDDVETLAARVEPLVRACLGKRREAGWLVRKLRREAVDPGLCAVRLERDEPIGFVFSGRPPSLGGGLRTAGLGVRPEARRRGHGRALLAWIVAQAEHRRAPGVQCLVEPHLEPLYGALGFSVQTRRLTLVWPCTAAGGSLHGELEALERSRDASITGAGGLDGATHRDLCRWLPEAWNGTEPDRRAVLNLRPHGWRALLSRERAGWLVQRLTVPNAHLEDRSALVAGLTSLRKTVPGAIPLFFYGLPEPFVHRHGLLQPGPGTARWMVVAQRFAVMERFTSLGDA